MKVREVIERLNKNEPLTVIAKQLNISPYLLSKKLRMLGYIYDSRIKKRVFVGEGKELLDADILDVSYDSNKINSKPSYEELIYKEIVRIRVHLENIPKSSHLVNYTEKDRIRRSFTIGREVLRRLDNIASISGMQKSRIVELAIIEWLQGHEKN